MIEFDSEHLSHNLFDENLESLLTFSEDIADNVSNVGEDQGDNEVDYRLRLHVTTCNWYTTPSCMIFPINVGNIDFKPRVIPLLPRFHGLDSESPNLHLKEFDEVVATLHFTNVSDDVVGLYCFHSL